MDKLNEPEPPTHDEILEKLLKVEEKLKKLQEFSERSEELRSNRKKIIENLMEESNKNISSGSKNDLKKVKFADKENADIYPRNKTRKSSFKEGQRHNSLYNLLTNLQTWQGEVKTKKSEIEMLKTRRQTLVESEEVLSNEEKIKRLQQQKDELDEQLLHFILQNMSEGKEEYQNFILQLEDENKAMEDRIDELADQVTFLKENNKALMRENDSLRRNISGMTNTFYKDDLDRKFRSSILSGKSSTMLPEVNMFYSSQNIKSSPSVQVILDMEFEDRLSLDKLSEDSFTLDKQIATWKFDNESLHDNLKKLEKEAHEMEVIQMKLNFVKRYVRKHGVKIMNKNTLIDPNPDMDITV